jgi:hypothetical protein
MTGIDENSFACTPERHTRAGLQAVHRDLSVNQAALRRGRSANMHPRRAGRGNYEWSGEGARRCKRQNERCAKQG